MSSYQLSCCPGAVSAVLGCSREWAAATLRRIAARDGWQIVDEEYTDRQVLATALTDAGLVLEDWPVTLGSWRTGAVQLATRPELDQILAGVAEVNQRHAAIAEPSFGTTTTGRRARREYDRLLRAARAVRAERNHRRFRRPLTVEDWLARFPIATWTLFTHRHVLVARAGRLVAGGGDGRYDGSPLEAAWRIVRPKEMR